MQYEHTTLSFYVNGEPSKGFLGLSAGVDPRVPNLEALNAQLSSTFDQLTNAGYEIVHVMPIQIASTIDRGKHPGHVVCTRGAAVVGRRAVR
jgi:hypothetical protein